MGFMLIQPPADSGPLATRQRMRLYNVESAWPPSPDPGSRMTAWTSDPSAPSTLMENAIVVQGGGSATLTAFLNVYSPSDPTSTFAIIEVRVNGVVLLSTQEWATTVNLGPVPVDLAAGDVIDVWHRGASMRTQSGSWVEVAPA